PGQEEAMRRALIDLMRELESHGIRIHRDGRILLYGEVPPGLLMRAHRNRRALAAAARR
ncbi:MAG: hypothetical protein RLY86_2668, partial [Pseudomonadota bacterium]